MSRKGPERRIPKSINLNEISLPEPAKISESDLLKIEPQIVGPGEYQCQLNEQTRKLLIYTHSELPNHILATLYSNFSLNHDLIENYLKIINEKEDVETRLSYDHQSNSFSFALPWVSEIKNVVLRIKIRALMIQLSRLEEGKSGLEKPAFTVRSIQINYLLAKKSPDKK